MSDEQVEELANIDGLTLNARSSLGLSEILRRC